MIKVFTLNANKKIELTKEELEKLLDEAYWEGYRNRNTYWTYTTPNYSPYITTCTNTSDGSVTISTQSTGTTMGEINNGTLKV